MSRASRSSAVFFRHFSASASGDRRRSTAAARRSSKRPRAVAGVGFETLQSRQMMAVMVMPGEFLAVPPAAAPVPAAATVVVTSGTKSAAPVTPPAVSVTTQLDAVPVDLLVEAIAAARPAPPAVGIPGISVAAPTPPLAPPIPVGRPNPPAFDPGLASGPTDPNDFLAVAKAESGFRQTWASGMAIGVGIDAARGTADAAAGKDLAAMKQKIVDDFGRARQSGGFKGQTLVWDAEVTKAGQQSDGRFVVVKAQAFRIVGDKVANPGPVLVAPAPVCPGGARPVMTGAAVAGKTLELLVLLHRGCVKAGSLDIPNAVDPTVPGYQAETILKLQEMWDRLYGSTYKPDGTLIDAPSKEFLEALEKMRRDGTLPKELEAYLPAPPARAVPAPTTPVREEPISIGGRR